MNDGGKSDKPIVPRKGANKEDGPPYSAERPEERRLAKGKPSEQTRFWTQGQIDLHHARDRIRKAAAMRHHPRQEPGAVIPHAGIRAGGGPQGPSLPRPSILDRSQEAKRALCLKQLPPKGRKYSLTQNGLIAPRCPILFFSPRDIPDTGPDRLSGYRIANIPGTKAPSH